jgi:hypothetical protein
MKDYRVEIVHVYVQAADEEEAITEAIIKLEDRPELYFVPVLLKPETPYGDEAGRGISHDG